MSDITPILPNAPVDSAGGSLVLTEAPPIVAPVVRSMTPRPFEVRIWSIFTFLVCFGMLGMGLYLTPSPDGFGKKQGLFGLPPCGFYLTTGLPCPTCGCTTAVSHFAHGHILTSLETQPFGFGVAVVALIAGCLSAFGAITGKWIGPSMFMLQWYWRVWVFGGLGLLVGGWVYKMTMVHYGL